MSDPKNNWNETLSARHQKDPTLIVEAGHRLFQALEASERELVELLKVAIARGEELGCMDEDYRERLGALEEEAHDA